MKNIVRLSLVSVFLMSVTCNVSALDQIDPIIAPINSLNYSDQITSIDTATTSAIALLSSPVLVSPDNWSKLYHYPRVTTLNWQPVTGATSYKVEVEYYDSAWHPFLSATVSGIDNTSYTFNFVGDQKGRWRVTAYNGTTPSTPSGWWVFSYMTSLQMPTPVLINPVANEVFSNYPRWVTLSWKPIPAATGYKLERSYCQAGNTNCVDYPPVIINDPLQAYYTFEFVGLQPGRWRVTTTGAPAYLNSAPSAWRYFTFDK